MKNRAQFFLVDEESNDIYLSTIYGNLDVSHLLRLIDSKSEDSLRALATAELDLIKVPSWQE